MGVITMTMFNIMVSIYKGGITGFRPVSSPSPFYTCLKSRVVIHTPSLIFRADRLQSFPSSPSAKFISRTAHLSSSFICSVSPFAVFIVPSSSIIQIGIFSAFKFLPYLVNDFCFFIYAVLISNWLLGDTGMLNSVEIGVTFRVRSAESDCTRDFFSLLGLLLGCERGLNR